MSFLLKMHEAGMPVQLVVTTADLLEFAEKVRRDALEDAAREKKAAKRETPREEYVDRKQAAEMLNVSIPTIARWQAAGILTTIHVGRKVYFRLAEVEERRAGR